MEEHDTATRGSGRGGVPELRRPPAVGVGARRRGGALARRLPPGQVALLSRHVPSLRSAASFGMQTCPRPNVFAVCTVCLACGHVTAQYSRPSRGLVEAPAEGSAWAPRCVAVQRLRDCVLRPYSVLRAGGWRVSARNRPGEHP